MLVNADRAVACHRWLSPRDLPAFTFSGMGDAGFNVEPDPAPARFLGTPFAADLDCGKCYCVLPGGQVLPFNATVLKNLMMLLSWRV